jgi:hypothetical protein
LLAGYCFKPANLFAPAALSVSDLKSSRLAGFKAFIWSNLCTRS